MFPLRPLRSALIILSAIFANPCFGGDLLLLGATDKPAVSYQPGEKMTFEVRLVRDGEPVEGTRLSWVRSGDDGLREKGEAISSAKPLVIGTSLEKPGFVRVLVTALDEKGQPLVNEQKKEIVFDGGAGVEPAKLHSVPEPKDFDAWWTAQKALLAKVPLEVIEQKPVPEQRADVETFDVKIACAGGMPVSGYLSKTKNLQPRSAVARVSFQGYGVSPASRQDEWAGKFGKPVIALNINAHGIENGLPREDYVALSKARLKGYAFDPEQNAKPETAYYYGMALRVLRALEFVKSLPEWDGKTLIVEGGSQGGFQALLAASLDPAVTRCVAVKPWACDLGGITLGRLKGWRPDYTPALGYFDPVNHAKRIRCETRIVSGLGDYVCPPSGISVLYNNLPATTPKRIEYQQGATHQTTPPNVAKFVIENSPGQ
jgi:cephalosporin-C deacetylase